MKKTPTMKTLAANTHLAPSRLSKKLLTQLLALGLLTSVSVSSLIAPAAAQMPNYSYYYNQATAFYSKGQLTKSIETFERALPLASSQSIPIVHNNLAAIYMKRGNYMLEKKRNYANALSDYRRALYLLDMGWPEGLPHSSRQKANLNIAKDNLKIGYTNLRIKPEQNNYHHKAGQQLRATGKFHESLVELALAARQKPDDTVALRAMADLFNVINRPQKSRKYYDLAIKAMGDQVDAETLVLYGNALNKSGRIDDAVVQLNRALELNPKDINALKQLESIWMREIKYNPRSVLAHANLASVFQKRGNYRQALKAYQNAENFAQRDPSVKQDVQKQIRINVGTLYTEMRDVKMAEQAFTSVLQIDPNNTLAHYYLAVLYKESRQPVKAIQEYNRLLALEPNNEEAHADLLLLIKHQPNQQKVASDLKDYGRRYADSAIVQSKVGEEFHSMKNYPEAESHYRRAIQLDPQMASAHANLGAVLQAQGRNNEALPYLKTAAQLDPHNTAVSDLVKNAEASSGTEYYRQAVVLHGQGKEREAIALYEKALAVPGTDSADLRAAYGISLQQDGQYKKAIAQYDKALKQNPTNGNYDYYKATAHHQNSDTGKAMLSYERALRDISLDTETRTAAETALQQLKVAESGDILNKAYSAYERHSHAQALNLISTALKHDPENATAYYYRALVYSDQNKTTQSVASYRKALKYDPKFKEVYYGLGVELEKKNDKPGAKSAYQKFLELSGSQSNAFTQYAKGQIKVL